MPKNFKAIDYEPGEMIINQGGEGNHLVYIMNGKVEVIKEIDGSPEVVATLGSGDILGEMSLLTGEPRNASARAAEKTRVVQFDERVFQYSLINDEMPILRDIMIQLASRTQTAEAKNVKYRKRITELEEQVKQSLLMLQTGIRKGLLHFPDDTPSK